MGRGCVSAILEQQGISVPHAHLAITSSQKAAIVSQTVTIMVSFLLVGNICCIQWNLCCLMNTAESVCVCVWCINVCVFLYVVCVWCVSKMCMCVLCCVCK